jgi:hypothetical protein
MPSSTSRVGARSWAGSEQWCRCHVPRSLPQEANLAAHPAPLPTNDPRARVCTVGHAIALATAQPPPTTTAKSKRHLCWPSTARASFERQAPTRADHEPVVDAAGDHADPGHPSRAAACPTAALHDLTSAGHSGRGNARTPDTGQRTPGRSDARTGHWTPVAWTGMPGQARVDTGRSHRTLDAGRWPRTPTG